MIPPITERTRQLLALEGDLALSAAEELYRVDVRDLLVNAEFATDVRAHERWCDAQLAAS
jgi:hypothetical protein